MIRIIKTVCSGHDDPRRSIIDFCLPDGMEIPFKVRQIKTIEIKQNTFTHKVLLGNHYHPIESGRHEFFIIDGPSDVPIFDFWYRHMIGGPILQVQLYKGDACDIPPGCSHTFETCLREAVLQGFSNLPYDTAHDVVDILNE